MRGKRQTLILGVSLMSLLIMQSPTLTVLYWRNWLAIQTIERLEYKNEQDAPDQSLLHWEEFGSDISRKDWATRRLLWHIHMQTEYIDEAADILNVYAEVCPDQLTCFWQGQSLIQRDSSAVALGKLQKIPNTDVYYAFLGDITYSQGDHNKAIQLYELSWDINPRPMFQKATMFSNLCDHYRYVKEVAETWCLQAVASSPNYWTIIELGRIYYESGKQEQAQETLRAAIALNPNQGVAYRYLGLSLYRLGNKEEGLNTLYVSIKLEPNNAWSRLELGDILVDQGAHLAAYCQYIIALDIAERETLRQTLQARINSLPHGLDAIDQCNE